MKTAPLLSIGMIFKNEARCIERCLQSLQPLRDAIPCELIMADTGAEDGSREIAEQYADEVFDFPWIDDFAAARNAVMDRCTGKWYLSIDCDEWLDEDISELVGFLKGYKKTDYGFVVQRNYHAEDLEKSDYYNDFHALRLLRMSTGKRFHGAIHEAWGYQEPAERLAKTIFHHDGYLLSDPNAAKQKMKRNMILLRQKLESDPENLLTLTQCIESGEMDPGYVQYIRQAVNLVQNKRGRWKRFGSVIMRYAVRAARSREMPELEEWIDYAEREFADSVFTKIDLNNFAFFWAHDAKEWKKAIRYGEAYQKGLLEFRSGQRKQEIEIELSRSTLLSGSTLDEYTLSIGLADAYLHNEQAEKALELFAKLDGSKLQPKQVQLCAVLLGQLHAQSMQDISSFAMAFHDQIAHRNPDEKACAARLSIFDLVAAAAFTEEYREKERDHDGWHRPAYTAFRCLSDKCEAGRAAAIMMTCDLAEIRERLLAVEDWQALPIEALEHALQAGVAFPLPEKPLPAEVLDGLAAKLTHNNNSVRQMVLAFSDDAQHSSLQSLFWTQSLVLAALRSFDWSLGKNAAPVSKFARPEKKKEPVERPEDTPETGLTLIRRFAQTESAVLPLFYTPQALAGENAVLLPPMHRWGLFCSLAFEALDAGKPQEYLALLRKGLKACPGEKDMVQFLLDRFMEDARPKANPELLALAERVRMILAAYAPNDPAVAALKASPVYRQVAWLIEPEPTGQMIQ